MAWANWNDVFDEEEFDADEDLGCAPKLYVADSGTGNVVLTYVGHIQRTCLVSEVSTLRLRFGVRLSGRVRVSVTCLFSALKKFLFLRRFRFLFPFSCSSRQQPIETKTKPDPPQYPRNPILSCIRRLRCWTRWRACTCGGASSRTPLSTT